MANISFVHARDHADVLFVGTLDWEAAHELVTTLETLFDHYFYRQVELLVASPGGDTRALAYYLNAVRNWSNKGIRFRTRVISTAASAGAFMVSLGDERVAEPGARLIYHQARACNVNDLTASAITDLHSVLRRLDDGMIGILAARALEGSANTPKVPHKAERSDREVLERLHAGLKPRKRKTRSKRRQFARAIVAVAILSFVAGLVVCWIPASESRNENELVPCLRVVEVVRLAGTVPKSRGSILVVRIERAPGHGSIELQPGGEATCDPAELDLPIPPIPNVVFWRRGLVFEPMDAPRRRASPRIPIPVEKTNRLTQSNPTHGTSRETT